MRDLHSISDIEYMYHNRISVSDCEYRHSVSDIEYFLGMEQQEELEALTYEDMLARIEQEGYQLDEESEQCE